MATMTIRTTVAFDPATAARLERLAKRWGISKSETMRRALEAAEAAENAGPSTAEIIPDFSAMTRRQLMDWLADNPQPPIPGGWGHDSQRELREMRERDAEIEDERERAHSKVAETPTPYPA